MADKKVQSRGINVKIDIDVSEAIIGLKALQREAKEATRLLREYESSAQRLQADSPIDFIWRSYE